MSIDVMNHAERLLRSFLFDGNNYAKCVQELFTTVRGGVTAEDLISRQETGMSKCLTATVSLREVKACSEKLYLYFISLPVDMLIATEKIMQEFLAREMAINPSILVTVSDNPEITPVADLQPEHVDAIVSVAAVVVTQSFIKPVMIEAAFQCVSKKPDGSLYCGYMHHVPVIGNQVQSPEVCPKCSRKEVKLDTTLSKYKDRQSVKLQDIAATTNDWSHNQGVIGILHDPYVHFVRPGDRIIVHALFKVVPARVNPRVSAIKSVFKSYLDIIHIEKVNSCVKLSVDNLQTITENQLAIFKNMANRKKLVSMFAPGIELLDNVKLGLLCSIVGGNTIDGKTRGCIHTLLCGDPATAKSQLLGATKKVTNRSTYVCGRGTTSAGLTATVVRDAETSEFLLEPGAVVVADQGLCCIDEFDKIDDSGKIVLNELMEQQTVSVAKAGIVCTLNARTSIVACANPIGSKFDSKKSISENINMPLTLLSRFDLIFLLSDPNDSSYDNRIAKSLLEHYDPQNKAVFSDMASSTSPADIQLKQYLSYVKENVHPVLTPEAQQLLKESYCSMRTNNNQINANVTSRRLKSLIRISEALARLELRETVDSSDVNEALLLVSSSTSVLSRNTSSQHEGSRVRSLIMQLLRTNGDLGMPEREIKMTIINSMGIKSQIVADELVMLERGRSVKSSIVGVDKMYYVA